MSKPRRPLLLPVIAALLIAPAAAGAWGSTGHRLIARLAVMSLPADVPAFLKAPEALDQIGELSREPDRSRLAGQPHDEDLDPGHFQDVMDDGTVLGGPSLNAMPPSRDAFSAAVHAGGADLHKSGYLYYNLIDGYQQLAKDFGYWRVDAVGETRGDTLEHRRWFRADRKLRELIIIRDLGYWSHFVGDASQPMHASVHYNGWGDFPNPHGYTQEHFHLPFEGAFVRDHLTAANVQAAMTAPTPCADPIARCVAAYLAATQTKVEPLYALWTAGGFKEGDPRGTAFAAERVAAGADALRDLVARAWHESRDEVIGFDGAKVSAIEDGAPLPFGLVYGDD